MSIVDVLESRSVWHIEQADCLEALKTMPNNSVDAIVTDPPAGIAFMGKSWDKNQGGRDQWIAWLASIMRECLRVCKPGAHALVWSLPRMQHWTATAPRSLQGEDMKFKKAVRLANAGMIVMRPTGSNAWELRVEPNSERVYTVVHDTPCEHPIEYPIDTDDVMSKEWFLASPIPITSDNSPT